MAIFRGKRFIVFAGLTLMAALGLAACGGGGSIGGGYGGYGGSTSTASGASVGGASLNCATGAAVCTKTVTVGGQKKTALADTKGLTLYYFTPDTASTVACTGACAQTWPPLASVGGSVTGTGLSGSLTTLSGANGAQVEYNGHPLYRYSGDKAQGDVNGEGIGGKWFVATTTLAASSGAAPGSATPTSAPGY